MRAVVTGADGFVGRYLAEHLSGLGYEVLRFERENEDKGSGILHGDIRDKGFVRKALEEIKPDRVYHLAAISFVPHSDIGEIYEVNFLGALNIYEVLSGLGREVRLLFVSSSNVYGNVPRELQPISEEQPLNPLNHYAVSKAAGELLAGVYEKENLRVVIARPFNHTGVGQSPDFVVPKLVKAFSEKRSTLSLGNIDVVRDFSDVRDVVRAYGALLEKGRGGTAYNVCSGRAYSIRDIVSALSELTGHRPAVEEDAALLRSTEISFMRGDNSRIRRDAGWEPSIDFRETLRWMYDAAGGSRG